MWIITPHISKRERLMQITCEGRETVIEKSSGDEVLTAMMAHGEEVHSNLFDGKSPDEI